MLSCPLVSLCLGPKIVTNNSKWHIWVPTLSKELFLPVSGLGEGGKESWGHLNFHLLCMTFFSAADPIWFFYSSCNFNTFLKVYFLVFSLPVFGLKDLICHIKCFFVTRGKKCAYWTFVPLSLPLSLFSLSFCLFFFFFSPSISNFLKAMYQYCVFASSVMFVV